jgi:hypothetical protein
LPVQAIWTAPAGPAAFSALKGDLASLRAVFSSLNAVFRLGPGNDVPAFRIRLGFEITAAAEKGPRLLRDPREVDGHVLRPAWNAYLPEKEVRACGLKPHDYRRHRGPPYRSTTSLPGFSFTFRLIGRAACDPGAASRSPFSIRPTGERPAAPRITVDSLPLHPNAGEPESPQKRALILSGCELIDRIEIQPRSQARAAEVEVIVHGNLTPSSSEEGNT